jgi:hypothetical protein
MVKDMDFTWIGFLFDEWMDFIIKQSNKGNFVKLIDIFNIIFVGIFMKISH